MGTRISLGRIWTVPIQGTSSLGVLIAAVAVLAGWQYRSIVHGYAWGEYALAGLLSAAVFVWTVFAHEAAHIVAARHYGARVNGVTLSLLGGQTAISGQPGSPLQGVVVAAAGPGVSALCGAVSLGGAFAAAALNAPVLVPLALAWVGLISFLLAAANMIPAAPLDGGHVLQALVWAGTGSRVRASIVAGYAGQFVGAAMLAWGLWLGVFDRSFLAAVATGIVGWPVWRGAAATRRVAQQRQLLGGVTVNQLMRANAASARADEPVSAAIARLGGTGSPFLAILDDRGMPQGIVGAARVHQAALDDPGRPVGRLMRRRRKLIDATASEPAADVLERSYGRPVPVLVVADGVVLGVLDPDDVRRALDQARAAAPSTSPAAPDVWPGRAR